MMAKLDEIERVRTYVQPATDVYSWPGAESCPVLSPTHGARGSRGRDADRDALNREQSNTARVGQDTERRPFSGPRVRPF